MDSRGAEDAMPKAYAWAERAYSLTKHGIRQMGLRPEYAVHTEALDELGLKYENELGDQRLAVNAAAINIGDMGWEVIRPAEEVTRNTWAEIKKIIPKS
jgi:hypothetical protein